MSAAPLFLLISVALAASYAADRPPAFPGAEGFGSKTPGGRGGKVILVSNLNDSGPGSFRAACEAKGPRIVVFRVSGLIDLKTAIVVNEPFITIAGQTTPGDGICLRRHGLVVQTHDVIARFLRSRPGDLSGKEVDAISIGGDSHNVILDHCSAGWSVDECLSPSGAIADITVEWCLIAEGLNHSVHHKGAHGYGSLVRAIGGVSLHHNLWAHNTARNPRLGDNYNKPPFPTFDFRNNVIYNYGGICSGMTGDILSVNYVANYIKAGPSSNRQRGLIVFTTEADAKYYIADNFVEGRPDLTAGNSKMFDRTQLKGRKLVTLMSEPFPVPKVSAASAQAAYPAVLAGAGASLPVRDAADERIIAEVRNGTGAIIDSQWEVGGWPVYRSKRPPADTDRDGMPDAWEKAHGLNPDDPSDATADRDGDGYTNLEEYINELATGAPQPRKSNLRK